MKSLIAIAMIVFATSNSFASYPMQPRPSADSGPSSVSLEQGTLFVEITGPAAELVFKSLNVQSYFSKPPGATVSTENKNFGMIACGKTGEDYSCSVAADYEGPVQ